MSAKIGTKENPCTLENSTVEDIFGNYCRCSACGCVELCTFGFDFYETRDGQFLCEPCFGRWMSGLPAFPDDDDDDGPPPGKLMN